MPDYKRLPKAALPAAFALLFLLLPSSHADSQVCSEGCDYTDISAALNASSPGDTITVSGGLYQDPLLISDRIVLHGQDSGDGLPMLAPQNGRVVLAASGTVLRGFQISGPRTEPFRARAAHLR